MSKLRKMLRVFKRKTGMFSVAGNPIREGDKVKCETDWNFHKAQMIGTVIYRKEKACFCVKGVIKEQKRTFALNECWSIKIL